jgi:arylsulfatase A-like enzyme
MPLNRRRFLQTSGLAAAALVAGCKGRVGKDARPPNILFVLSDDQRNDTLGCTGNRIVRTPNIDAVASQGSLFRNAFVTTPICPSSRASILTGVTETRHHFTFRTPPLARALCDASYPALFHRAGYRTGMVGKFGVQMAQDAQRGIFDVFEERDRPYDRRLPDGRPRHVDEINTDSALAFLEGCSADRPFMLAVNYSSAHAEDADMRRQYHPIEWARDLYRDTVFPPPMTGDPRYFASQPDFLKHSMNRERYQWRFATPEKYQESMRDYYRMLSGLDHMVGLLVERLRQRRLLDDTIIVYASDNGCYMGDRGFADKWSHYDESLRVPMIVADFRAPPAPRVVDAMALNVDLPATLLDLAGLDVPPHYQGRSLVPCMAGVATSWRQDFLCQHTMDDPGIPKWVGVRSERYMYARYFEQQPAYEVLHDLRADPTEFRNLAHEAGYAAVLEAQRARCATLQQALD